MQPEYDTPYGIPETSQIVGILDRVYTYLEATTPTVLVGSKNEITDYSRIPSAKDLHFKQGDFRLISYEWGVTYAGMLLAGEATGNKKYADYAKKRIGFLAELYPYFKLLEETKPGTEHPMKSILHPHALDDAGALCAAMIKAKRSGFDKDLEPMIDNFIDYISTGQYRLEDGTLARNRPMKNSLWLDDLFMAVPALAQMGKYTGEAKYYDDAARQVLQFANRMFNEEKGLFMHAYVVGMESHPEFYWGRANGWAVMTLVELLEVLPENHKDRSKLIALLQKHIKGLVNLQSPQGLWHQLVDRNDSFLETSATAIFTYSIARAINRGYVDPQAYGPAVCLAWNAIATKINDRGQVEGTCVGTGMGFDPAYYYYRPVNVYAAHGYGPVLLAGAEMIGLLEKFHPKMNDSAVQFYTHKIATGAPIFKEE
jgi:rhamnogalacturonyl hydrolase YesR